MQALTLDYSATGSVGSVDVYKSNTTDQLQEMRIPAANGVTSMYINLGEVSNKGIDVALSSVNINKGGFTWTTDIVFSKNKESIVTIDGTNNNNLLNLWMVGQPIRVYYNYVSDGIYQYSDTAERWIASTITYGQKEPIRPIPYTVPERSG